MSRKDQRCSWPAEGEGDSALGGLRSREGPVKGEYASDVKLLSSSQVIPDALLPLIEVRSRVSKMIKDSRHSQTVKVVKRENICTYSKRLGFLLLSVKIGIYQKKVLTNASFWHDVSWWTSLTQRRVGRPIQN